MEILERIPALADTDQLDRLARDRAHGECRTAAPVAIDTGQHDAGNTDALVEALREVDRILAGQAVGDEQRLVRLCDVAHVRRFLHQFFVDMNAAGRVEQHDIVAAELARLDRARRNLLRCLPRNDRQCRDARLLAEHAQLLLRCRPARIERGHEHFLLVAVREALGDLRARRRFTGALETDEHDRHGRRRGKIDRLTVGAEHLDQFVVHDLDDHLAGRDRFHDVCADRLGLHLVGERADHIERHIGLEERPADLAHGLVDIALAQRTAPGEPVEDA